MSARFFFPRSEAVQPRTSGQRGGMLRETRDGAFVTVGRVRSRWSVRRQVAQNLAAPLLLAGVVLGAFYAIVELAPEIRITPKPACVDPSACADDAPTSEGP